MGININYKRIGPPPVATLFKHEFSLEDRVALVSGGNRGLGLEMALALIEAGARAVYCVDLQEEPSEEWKKVRDYAQRLTGKVGEGRLEYMTGDVTNQVSRLPSAVRLARRQELIGLLGSNLENWATHR